MRNIMCTIALTIAAAMAASLLQSERCRAQTRNEFGESWGTADSVATVNRPSDLVEPWKIGLKSGASIICNRGDISLSGEELFIRGTLKRMEVPRADVRSLAMQEPATRFRDGFIAGLYLGSVRFLSPSDMPGGYAAVKEKGFGLNLTSLLVAGITALCGGAILGTMEPEVARLTLDGSEDEEGWKLLLKGNPPKWHLRGTAAYVGERGEKEWKDYFEQAGGTKETYYYSTIEDDATRINFLRSFGVSYSLSERFELGASFMTGGVPTFYREIPYYTSGNPPVTSTVTLYGYYRTAGYYVAAAYLPLTAKPGAFSVRLAGMLGLGTASFDPNEGDTYIYTPSMNGQARINSLSRLAGALGASLDYNFDPRLSLGLSFDYSILGKAVLPAEEIRDYSGVVRVRLPGREIDLNSWAVGIVVCVSY